MPIFEYRCQDCGVAFEALLRGNEEVKCPQCGSMSLEKLLSAPVVLSGRAARAAGHTCCGREERCDKPPCSDGRGCQCG